MPNFCLHAEAVPSHAALSSQLRKCSQAANTQLVLLGQLHRACPRPQALPLLDMSFISTTATSLPLQYTECVAVLAVLLDHYVDTSFTEPMCYWKQHEGSAQHAFTLSNSQLAHLDLP